MSHLINKSSLALGIGVAVLVTGCASTDTLSNEIGQMITTSVQDITTGFFGTSASPQMDSQGWVVAYKVPKNAPEYHIDINKPSARKYGSRVEYKTRVVYLTKNQVDDTVLNKLKGTSYRFSSGNYIANDVVVNCNTMTYGTLNHAFYDKNDNLLIRCPWKDKSQVAMQGATSGSIMEHTIRMACKGMA